MPDASPTGLPEPRDTGSAEASARAFRRHRPGRGPVAAPPPDSPAPSTAGTTARGRKRSRSAAADAVARPAVCHATTTPAASPEDRQARRPARAWPHHRHPPREAFRDRCPDGREVRASILAGLHAGMDPAAWTARAWRGLHGAELGRRQASWRPAPANVPAMRLRKARSVAWSARSGGLPAAGTSKGNARARLVDRPIRRGSTGSH